MSFSPTVSESAAWHCGEFSRSRSSKREMSRRFDERCTMQSLCHCAVMVAVASPAFAQSASKAQKQLLCSRHRMVRGGHKRYNDPNIQFEMMRQQNLSKGG